MSVFLYIERPAYFIFKNFFKRNRPQAALKNFQSLITPSDQFCFPSGHTSAALLFAVISRVLYLFYYFHYCSGLR